MEHPLESPNIGSENGEHDKNRNHYEIMLILGELAIENQEIAENFELAQAIEADDIDIIIKEADLDKPKLCIKNKVKYPGKKWIAITATPFYTPSVHLFQRGKWQEKATCSDFPLEIFFLKYESLYYGASGEIAYDICAKCPVRVDCLEAALFKREKTGIWAGLNALILNRLNRGRQRLYQDRLSEEHLAIRLENTDLSSAIIEVLAKNNISTVEELLSTQTQNLVKLLGFTNLAFEEWREKLLELALSEPENLDQEPNQQEAIPDRNQTQKTPCRQILKTDRRAMHSFEPYYDPSDFFDNY